MSENSSEMLLCYNRGCGQTFDPSKNTEESCVFHPGAPVFHDAYKKWSCCGKKSTDFTDFLNYKGCTKSYHSSVKPPVEAKVKEDNSNKNEVLTYMSQPLKPKAEIIRPDVNIPMSLLKSTISPSLKSQLEKVLDTEETVKADGSNVSVGTPCKNGGCKAVYKGEESNMETCIYHSGYPVFHEGLKYWTCCVKRTTDFDSFLEQVGCTTGNHLWHKPSQNKTTCRYDWHQTGNSVVISVYSKCPFPDQSWIEANPVKLKLYIVFGRDKEVFDSELHLFGVIDVEHSSVTFLGSKVEINLKKAEALSWTTLQLSNKVLSSMQEDSGDQDINVNNI